MANLGQRHTDAFYQDVYGQWWYVGAADGARRRIEAHDKKNKTRMFVGGKYIPKSHPLHKSGNFKSWAEVYSNKTLRNCREGYVYAAVNQAWPSWVKIGKAVDANDRLKSYQTADPHRGYKLIGSKKTADSAQSETRVHWAASRVAEERNGEWFKLPKELAVELIEGIA